MKKGSWIWTLMVSGGHFWVDFYQNMVPPLLPFIGILWGLSNSQLALSVSMQSMTANFLQPVFGYFVDRHPQKWSLGLAILITAIPMSFLYLSPGYQVFLLMVTFAGIGSALFHPLGATRAVEGINNEKAVKMSLFSGLGSLGFSISPAVTALVVTAWGIKGLAFMVIPGLLWVLLLRLTNNLKTIEHQTASEYPVTALKGTVNYKPLFILSFIVGLRSWLTMAVTVFIPLWMVAQGSNEKAVGLYLTIYLLAGTVGGFISGVLYKKIRPEKLLTGPFILSILLLPTLFIAAPAYRLVIFTVFGFILLGTSPITVVIGQELLPRQAAFASGVTMGLAFGLGGLGVSLTGLFADIWGTVNALLITSLALIPAIILTNNLHRMRRQQENCKNDQNICSA